MADVLLIRREYLIALPLPCAAGSELVSRIRQAGPGDDLGDGHEVDRPRSTARWGAYAERAIENQCERIPEDLPAPSAVALIGNYVTAHLALHAAPRSSLVRLLW